MSHELRMNNCALWVFFNKYSFFWMSGSHIQFCPNTLDTDISDILRGSEIVLKDLSFILIHWVSLVYKSITTSN